MLSFLKQKIKKEKNNCRYIAVNVSVFLFLVLGFIFISSFKPKETQKFYNKPPKTEDTIYVYDTVYYYDTTFVYDTVFLSKKIKESKKIFIKKLKIEKLALKDTKFNFLSVKNKNSLPIGKYMFSFSLSFSPMYFSHSFKSNYIYKEISLNNKKSVQEDLSGSFGLGINFHKPRITYSSGLYYTKFRENFNFLATDYRTDTVLAYRYFTTTEMRIDTVLIQDIDALPEIVYYTYYDTNYVSKIDSNLVHKIDTTFYKFNDKSLNTYSYIEIPIVLSYNFYYPNFTFSPQFGIITSFFVNSKGKIVSLANLNQSESLEKESRFADINMSIYGGVKFNYFLSARFDFFTSAYFRRNIHSIFKDYPINSQFNTFGLNFGIRYKLYFNN